MPKICCPFRLVYGSMVLNFKAVTTKSFKNKKRVEKPQEEWKIFKNTHPAIIDEETFALVQELRKHHRRPTRHGIISTFSGLLYCADCGKKLYYSGTGNYRRDQANFFCSTYRNHSNLCPAHISAKKLFLKSYWTVCSGYSGMCKALKKTLPENRWRHLAKKRKRSFPESAKNLR